MWSYKENQKQTTDLFVASEWRTNRGENPEPNNDQRERNRCTISSQKQPIVIGLKQIIIEDQTLEYKTHTACKQSVYNIANAVW